MGQLNGVETKVRAMQCCAVQTRRIEEGVAGLWKVREQANKTGFEWW